MPGVEVEVRERGELWIRGPNIMLGYWNRPEATAEALVDGWYRSGDIVTTGAQLLSLAAGVALLTLSAGALNRALGVPAPSWAAERANVNGGWVGVRFRATNCVRRRVPVLAGADTCLWGD